MVDKIRGGRPEAAFPETRTRGVDGLEGRLDTVDLASLMTWHDKGARRNLNDEHKTREVKHTSRANDRTRYGTLASNIRLVLGRSRESREKREGVVGLTALLGLMYGSHYTCRRLRQ